MKKFCKLMLFMVTLCTLTGCFLSGKTGQESYSDYERCNETSRLGELIETELGFYYVKDDYLYYADKSDLSTWVLVCNKPDCEHFDINIRDECNAYLPRRIVQKDGIFYTFDKPHNADFTFYEVSQDGSGRKKIFEVPLDGSDEINGYGFCSFLTNNQWCAVIDYLAEDGFYKVDMIRLEENDGKTPHLLYSETNESTTNIITMSGMEYVGVRGRHTICSILLVEEGEWWTNVLWDVSGDVPERINLPEELSQDDFLGSYLTDTTFTYYRAGEGFYEVKLATGEKKLLHESYSKESQSWGTILTEQYIVEHDLSANEEYRPKELYLRIYDGEKWSNVELPESVTKANNVGIAVRAVASDRILFENYQKDNIEDAFGLCYVMLEDLEKGTPKLEFFDSDLLEYVESTEESIDETDEEPKSVFDFRKIDEITIFDNEFCLLQVTGIGVREKDDEYIVEVYWENRAPETEYGISFLLGVNGIFVDPRMGLSSRSFNKDGYYDITLNPNMLINNVKIQSGLEDVYAQEEYTDIEMCCYLYDGRNPYYASNIIEEKVSIYPQGEDKAVAYEREPESTDIVIIDNEKLSVRVVGYEQTFIPYDTVKFFVENKTDKPLQFEIEEKSINNLVPYDGFSKVSQYAIPAGMCAFYFETVCEEDFIKEYGLTDAGTIQMLVRAYHTTINSNYIEENEENTVKEADLLKKLITLYPQGEDKAKTFVKESKNTDVVLIDNAYVTVISEAEKKSPTAAPNSNGMAIPLYVVNKTDKMLTLKLEALSINGEMEHISNFKKEYQILPNNSAIVYVTHFGKGDKKELLLRIYETGGGTIAEDLVTEQVTIVTGKDIK